MWCDTLIQYTTIWYGYRVSLDLRTVNILNCERLSYRTYTIALLAQRTNHCGKYRLNIPTNLSFIFISLRFFFSIWHSIRYRSSFCLEYCLTYLKPNKAAKSTRMNEIKRRQKKSQTNNLYAYGDDRKNEHANGNEML